FMRILPFIILSVSFVAACGSDESPVAHASVLARSSRARGSTRHHSLAAALQTTTAGGTVCSHHVQLNGNPGTVVAQPEITTVFWGSYWSASGASERTSYDQTWKDVGNNAAFYSRFAEYSTSIAAIKTGSWTGSVLTNSSLASGALITENQIRQ